MVDAEAHSQWHGASVPVANLKSGCTTSSVHVARYPRELSNHLPKAIASLGRGLSRSKISKREEEEENVRSWRCDGNT